MGIRTISIVVAAIACLAAAYRFALHGIASRDNFCIGLASVAVALAIGLIGIEVRFRQAKQSSDTK